MMIRLIFLAATAMCSLEFAASLSAANLTACANVLKVTASNMMQGSNPLQMVGVKGTSYSLGYSGLDTVVVARQTENASQACNLKMARIMNKYGSALPPTPQGAQAAVRSMNFRDTSQQQCIGFGLCANIWDGVEQDVYPVSTLTYAVIRTKPPTITDE